MLFINTSCKCCLETYIYTALKYYSIKQKLLRWNMNYEINNNISTYVIDYIYNSREWIVVYPVHLN